MKKLFSLLIVLGLLMGVVAAQDVPEEEVAIAAVGPFTGPAAAIGQEILNWTRLAVNDFNEANGWDVQIVEVDTEIDPAVAVTAVESALTNQSVYGAVGPAGSQVVSAVQQQFAEAGLVHVSSAATNPALTDEENNTATFFRVIPTDAVQGPTVGEYLATTLAAETLFIVDDQTSYAVGLGDAAAAAFEAAGGEVVGQESVTQDDIDFSALITRIDSTEADAIFFPGQLASQGALFATQLLEQGLDDVIFFGADGFQQPQEFIIDAAGATEGAYVSAFAPDVRGVEAAQDEIERYEEQFGEDFGTFGPPAYLAAQVVLEAMLRDFQADGALSRADTLTEVSITNIEESILGTPISFDANGDVQDAAFFIFQVQGDSFVFLSQSASMEEEPMDDMEEEEEPEVDATEEAGS